MYFWVNNIKSMFVVTNKDLKLILNKENVLFVTLKVT
jgi:hypothetical protein